MPLITFSINTATPGLSDRIHLGMEVGGVFTLRHTFLKIPHPDTEYTIKQVYINSAGDGRTEVRGERNKPTVWVGIDVPHFDQDIIVSERDTYSRYRKSNADDNTKFPDISVKNDTGLIRFPITTYPAIGDSNKHDRAANTSESSHHEARGNHNCNIPLGKLRLKDNVLEIKITPRNYLQQTYFDSDERITRFKGFQLILEYK